MATLRVAVPDSELLTVSQVADGVGASTQTIRNWIRAEQLEAVRIGNRFFIPQTELDRVRGDLAGSRLESPWEFDPDAPAEPLRRAPAAGSDTDPNGRFLGG